MTDTSGDLTSVTIGSQLAQTNVYTSNYLKAANRRIEIVLYPKPIVQK